jgi:predicted phosphodiesterase
LKIGIISDIHEDIDNLKKTMLAFEKINCDEIICLGDIVGFSYPYYSFSDKRNANECVDLVKRNCTTVVIGNHDLNAIKKIPEFIFKTQYPKNWFELSTIKKKNLLGGKVWLYEGEQPHNLNSENIDYLANLKEYEIRNFEGVKIIFSHYIFPNFSGSNCLFPSFEHDLYPYFNFIESNNCKFGILGHLHPRKTLKSIKSKNKISPFFNYPFKLIEFLHFKIDLKRTSCFSIPSLATNGEKHPGVILDTSNFELSLL